MKYLIILILSLVCAVSFAQFVPFDPKTQQAVIFGIHEDSFTQANIDFLNSQFRPEVASGTWNGQPDPCVFVPYTKNGNTWYFCVFNYSQLQNMTTVKLGQFKQGLTGPASHFTAAILDAGIKPAVWFADNEYTKVTP